MVRRVLCWLLSTRKEDYLSSEVARIREQIELESAAMRLALYGFAAVGKHSFIAHKYEAIDKCQEQLVAVLGEEQATALTVESYNRIMDSGEQPLATCITSPTPLHHLKTALLLDTAKEILMRHDCDIREQHDACIVSFPEGTMRAAISPQLTNQRFEIVLPDGYRLIEMDDNTQELNLLFFES